MHARFYVSGKDQVGLTEKIQKKGFVGAQPLPAAPILTGPQIWSTPGFSDKGRARPVEPAPPSFIGASDAVYVA